MFRCWHTDPEERQTFSELVRIMSQTLLSMADYLDVSTFGELEETAKEEAAEEETDKEETVKEETAKEEAGEESNCNGIEAKIPKDSVYYDKENKSLILNLTA